MSQGEHAQNAVICDSCSLKQSFMRTLAGHSPGSFPEQQRQPAAEGGSPYQLHLLRVIIAHVQARMGTFTPLRILTLGNCQALLPRLKHLTAH